MTKITLTPIVNLQNETTAVNAMNANSTVITTALDNTLSRDGTSPNTMGASLDMNSNRILNLPTAISVAEPVTLSQMTAALVANGNINTGITGVPVSAAMQPVVNASIASAKTQLAIPTPYIDATLPIYAGGVKADGVTDDTAALQAAVTAAAGREVFLPSGTIVLTSQVSYIVTVPTVSLFAPGLKIRGNGPAKTFIDNRVANNSCLYSAGVSGAVYAFGGYIKDLTIKTTTNPVNSHGIEYYANYQCLVENVYVYGLSGDGMRVTSITGDPDASNIMNYKNCRFDSCNIGLNCNFSAGVVQPSFMKVIDSFFQGNNIGWRYIGLAGTSINNAFTIHNTVGLQIVNNGSSNAQFVSLNTSFENNAKAIQIDSLQGGEFIQTELAGGAGGTPISTQAVVATAMIGVKFSGTRVRFSSTPHTLWTFASGATTNQICNSFYQNYDNAGQTRYSIDPLAFGNRIDDSFDSIVMGGSNGLLNLNCVNGSNENLALRLDGAFYNLVGPTGAFSIGGLTNGFNGRRLTFYNLSGQTLTINAEDVSSSNANRIRTENLANVTVLPHGCCSFIYDNNISKWHLVGKA